MLRLLLLRHAKATPFTGSGDHERALTEGGRADAARLGAFVAGEKIAPQAAVHSGSRRTGETLDIVLARLKCGASVSVEPRLYEASEAAFLSVLRHASDAAKTLLVVGHNPNMFQFLARLITLNGSAAIRMRKASVARVDTDHHPPRLQWLIDPRTVRNLYASLTKSSRPKTSRK